MTNEQWTDRSGVRIRYLDNAVPAQRGTLPIVFSPGVVDDADDYHALLEHFSARRVIVVDVRGRGRSESPPKGYAVGHLADDLAAAIDEAGINQFHLMTFSRGTPTALEVAFRRPERVVSLSIGDYRAAEIQLPDSWPEAEWGLRWRGKPVPERVQRHVLDGIQQDAVARDLWDDVAALRIPVLVAHGTVAGSIVDTGALDRFAEAISEVEFAPIPGAGHDLFRPDRLAYPRAVEQFVARVEHS
ncbi:MAG TPA: alpha/beta hydrolase [Acidimicrobiales bacterium]